MNRELNNKGFTLIELLAVLVILIAIMAIAIPTISSSLERTKDKQNQSRYKVIESAAELYVADHNNEVYSNLDTIVSCYIQISKINYLTDEEMEDSDGNELSGHYVNFTKPNTYRYSTTASSSNSCVTSE